MGGEFSPEWLAFEEELGYRPRLQGSLEDISRQWDSLLGDLVAKFEFPPPATGVKSEDRSINGNGITVRIYTPESAMGSDEALPLCVYAHGGGWAMGDLNSDDAQCREICKTCNVVVVSIDYRLAPAYPAPIPLDDCVEGFRWAVANANKIGASADKSFICGSSAGANLAIGIALKILDSERPFKLLGLILLAPPTVHPEAISEKLRPMYVSYEENSDTAIDTPSAMEGFRHAYGAMPTDPYCSPLLHSKLAELPKTYIAICGKDTLRDDARLLAAALKEGGVPVRQTEYEGMPHYFWTFPSKHLAEAATRFQADVTKNIEWILSDSEM